MRLVERTHPDNGLLQQGYWFVCGGSTLGAIGISWLPVAVFGIKMTRWTNSQIEVELAALGIAVIFSLAWRRWSRLRWEQWAKSRAIQTDKVRVQAMFDGILKMDRSYVTDYLERQQTPDSS